MHLTYGDESDQTFELDLDILVEDEKIADVEDLHTALYVKVGSRGLISIDVEDGSAFPIPKGEGRLLEVAKLAWFVYNESHLDLDQLFAVMNGLGWKWTDFDDLRSAVEDDFWGEFDGDYANFAQEWHDSLNGKLPSYLEDYIDWESFGEELINDFAQFEWNDRTFLYVQ